MIVATFRQGEDGTLALDAVSGSVSLVESIEAFIVRSTHEQRFQRDTDFVPIALGTVARAAAGAFPAGWNLVCEAADTATLKPGVYGIDARLLLNDGTTDITDETALVKVTEAAVVLPAIAP